MGVIIVFTLWVQLHISKKKFFFFFFTSLFHNHQYYSFRSQWISFLLPDSLIWFCCVLPLHCVFWWSCLLWIWVEFNSSSWVFCKTLCIKHCDFFVFSFFWSVDGIFLDFVCYLMFQTANIETVWDVFEEGLILMFT